MECEDDAKPDSLMDEDIVFGNNADSSSESTIEVPGLEDAEHSAWDLDTSLVEGWTVHGVNSQLGSPPDEDDEFLPDEDDELDGVDAAEEATGDDGTQSELPAVVWSDDMLQTEEMASVGLVVNTRARVVLCLECRQAVKPKRLFDHIRRHLGMTLPLNACHDIIETFDLLQSPETARPGAVITAIYGLDLLSGYISCNTCGFACKTPTTMKTHKRQNEGCTHSQHKPRYVQTFTPTSSRMYFGVDLAESPPPAEEDFDPVAYLKQKYNPTPFSDRPITTPQNPRESNHFLQIEKSWIDFVKGKTGAQIHAAVREPEPELAREVGECVELYARKLAENILGEGNAAVGAIGDYTG